jgi:hypothetical protein
MKTPPWKSANSLVNTREALTTQKTRSKPVARAGLGVLRVGESLGLAAEHGEIRLRHEGESRHFPTRRGRGGWCGCGRRGDAALAAQLPQAPFMHAGPRVAALASYRVRRPVHALDLPPTCGGRRVGCRGDPPWNSRMTGRPPRRQHGAQADATPPTDANAAMPAEVSTYLGRICRIRHGRLTVARRGPR